MPMSRSETAVAAHAGMNSCGHKGRKRYKKLLFLLLAGMGGGAIGWIGALHSVGML